MARDRLISVLAGMDAVPQEVTSEAEMLEILNEGLPVAILAQMKQRGMLDESELRAFIPMRTLARRKVKLNAEESDLIARIARVDDFAIDVFGDTSRARKWLRTPNRALNGHVPFELLKTDYGARMVESILGRIAHGVFS